jgi:hypothetical protein
MNQEVRQQDSNADQIIVKWPNPLLSGDIGRFAENLTRQ